MIASEKKREEYRDATNRQCARLYNEAVWRNGGVLPDGLAAIFRNGYRMDSPALAVRLVGISIRSGDMAAHPEWGEPKSNRSHFVLKLGKIISVGSYNDIKTKMLKAQGKSK